MGRKPFFSVIIPAYNVSPYIKDTIEAIKSQSFTDWELIIVDDASTDNTRDILKDFEKEKEIKIIYSAKNSGNPYKVREKALECAEGKYIVPIDADDMIERDFLHLQHKEIIEGGYDITLPEMWRFNVHRRYKILPIKEVDTSRYYKGRDLVKLTLVKWQIPIAGFAIKRTVYKAGYEKANLHELNSIHSDELLSRYLLLLSEKVFFSKAQYFYRLNSASITHNDYLKMTGGYVTNMELVKFCEEYYGKVSEEYRLGNLQMFKFIYFRYNLLTSPHLNKLQKKEVARLISEYKSKTDIKYFKEDAGKLAVLIVSLPLGIGKYLYRGIDILKRLKKR